MAHLREREVVLMALYLVTPADPLLKAAVKHQVTLDKRGTYCVLRVANGVLAQYQLGMKYTEEGVFDSVARQFLEDKIRSNEHARGAKRSCPDVLVTSSTVVECQ